MSIVKELRKELKQLRKQIKCLLQDIFIPKKTSDLINDGEDTINPFITLQDIPNVPEYLLSPISGTNTVDLIKDGLSVSQIDLTPYLDDTNLARIINGILNPTTGILTVTRDDSSTFTINLSSLIDTQPTNTSELTNDGEDGSSFFIEDKEVHPENLSNLIIGGIGGTIINNEADLVALFNSNFILANITYFRILDNDVYCYTTSSAYTTAPGSTALSGNTNLTRFIETEGRLTNIDNHNYFTNCSNLEKVSLKGLVSLSHSCFVNCTSLEIIELPNMTLMDLNGNQFRGCTALENINFPLLETLGFRNFTDCTALKIVILPSLRNIVYFNNITNLSTFLNCSNLVFIDIPACDNLSDVNFNNNIFSSLNAGCVIRIDGINKTSNLGKEEEDIINARAINLDIHYVGSNLPIKDFGLSIRDSNGIEHFKSTNYIEIGDNIKIDQVNKRINARKSWTYYYPFVTGTLLSQAEWRFLNWGSVNSFSTSSGQTTLNNIIIPSTSVRGIRIPVNCFLSDFNVSLNSSSQTPWEFSVLKSTQAVGGIGTPLLSVDSNDPISNLHTQVRFNSFTSTDDVVIINEGEYIRPVLKIATGAARGIISITLTEI